ncbi:MAG: hypothetical protein AAFP90_06380, partial [Planctomycetota bacterium]
MNPFADAAAPVRQVARTSFVRSLIACWLLAGCLTTVTRADEPVPETVDRVRYQLNPRLRVGTGWYGSPI